MPSTQSRSVATIERATDVLFLFTQGESTLGVTEIARELDISKAVVHRILTSLRERDLIDVDETTRRYSLGPAVLQLAAGYRENLDGRALAVAAMRELSAATNETATLSIRSGDERIYVDQVTPQREVHMSVKVGNAYPLHAGASSKALLAFLPPGEIDDYLARGGFDSLTPDTITDPAILRRELDQIRQQGFAVSLGERQSGAASVAAPVFNDSGEVVMVISACGPLERFRDEIAETSALVVETTRNLSRALGRQDTVPG